MPAGVGVRNPAFDVTPAELVTAIITERGVFEPSEIADADRAGLKIRGSTSTGRRGRRCV
jgi:methylthioribose-1-phosphate isomerase